MSDIEAVRAKLNVAKTKYTEVARAAIDAEHSTDSLQLRLATAMEMIKNALSLNPTVAEAGSSLTDDYVNSISNVRTKAIDAHASLAEIVEGAEVDSPLGRARIAGDVAYDSALKTSANNNGVPMETDFTGNIREAFIGLQGIYEALSRADNGLGAIFVYGIPREPAEKVVSNIEAYEQGL